jgi:hypothetical protein
MNDTHLFRNGGSLVYRAQMSDGAKKDDDPKKDDVVEAPTSGPAKLATVRTTPPPIPPELLKEARSRVDPNVFIVQLGPRIDPHEMVSVTKAMLNVFQEDEERSLRNYIARSNAVTENKLKDPDEIEKRKTNGNRRLLRCVVALLACVMLGGGLAYSMLHGTVVLAGLMLTIGGMALCATALLASGESVTTTDLVRIANAFKLQLAPDAPKPDTNEASKGKGKKR